MDPAFVMCSYSYTLSIVKMNMYYTVSVNLHMPFSTHRLAFPYINICLKYSISTLSGGVHRTLLEACSFSDSYRWLCPSYRTSTDVGTSEVDISVSHYCVLYISAVVVTSSVDHCIMCTRHVYYHVKGDTQIPNSPWRRKTIQLILTT